MLIVSTKTNAQRLSFVLLYSYFEGERVDTRRLTQILDWEANANCLQILLYTQEIRDKNCHQ